MASQQSADTALALAAAKALGKASRDDLLARIEADPAFLKFQEQVNKGVRPSTVPKLLKIVEGLVSKEYKAAMAALMQQRTKDPKLVIEAVRQEALRKLMHEEDERFGQGMERHEFTKEELHQKLDEAARRKQAHFIEADAATNVASPSGLALPSPSRTRRDADP